MFKKDRFIGAHKNCPDIKKCNLIKYFYTVKRANDNYIYTLKTAVSMLSSSLNKFQKLLGDDYSKLFLLLLTDRGTEFSKTELFEVNTETSKIRSKILPN